MFIGSIVVKIKDLGGDFSNFFMVIREFVSAPDSITGLRKVQYLIENLDSKERERIDSDKLKLYKV